MKVEIENENYSYITDNSKEINRKGVFLITEHNKKYLKEVEYKGCFNFLKAEDLFQKWNLDKIKIIGITGTNGKTTTSNIIAHILKKMGFRVAVSGTEGVFLHSKKTAKKIAPRTHTTPEILTTLNNLRIAKEAGAEYFVMEVSSHGIFQKRIEGLKFAAKVFTNLSQDHLDFHKTMEEYARVKSSFFEDEESFKIINFDDQWIKYNKKNSLSYSLKSNLADLYAENFSFSDGIESKIYWKNKSYFLKSPMMGKFNLYNLLASIETVLTLTSFKMEEILESLKDFSGVAGRMELLKEVKKGDKNLKIFSDYAHTPDAIEKVLNSLNPEAKIITVIGAGGDRDKDKRPLMAQKALNNSDFLFLTSDNPRTEDPRKILEDMERGVVGKRDYLIEIDRKKAIELALKKAKEFLETGNDVILAILGKGDENYIEINGEKIDYSDREEVEKFF